LVRTGSTPGTTRQLNLFHIKASDGLELVLVDLPGYGYAKRGKQERSQWGTLIEHYLSTRVTLRAVVLLVDIRRGPEQEERELIDYIASTHRQAARPKTPVIIVATKADKMPRAQRKPALTRITADAGCRVLGFSAETGEGRDELWNVLREHLGTKGGPPAEHLGGKDESSPEALGVKAEPVGGKVEPIGAKADPVGGKVEPIGVKAKPLGAKSAFKPRKA
jgi:GTP-binding protein